MAKQNRKLMQENLRQDLFTDTDNVFKRIKALAIAIDQTTDKTSDRTKELLADVYAVGYADGRDDRQRKLQEDRERKAKQSACPHPKDKQHKAYAIGEEMLFCELCNRELEHSLINTVEQSGENAVSTPAKGQVGDVEDQTSKSGLNPDSTTTHSAR